MMDGPYPYPSSAYPWQVMDALTLTWQVMDGVEAVVEGEPAFDATTHRRRRPFTLSLTPTPGCPSPSPKLNPDP